MHILSIANSFGQDAQAYLHQIAASAGVALEAVNLFIGGCSLETHHENWLNDQADYLLEINGESTERQVSIREALEMRDWDCITLQQASHFSGMPETYEPHMSVLVKAIRESCPDARLYFHETWAYEHDSEHEGFAHYDRDQALMFDRISEAARLTSARHDLTLIPAGNLIQRLREEAHFDVKRGGRSLCRDGFHLDLLYGRYAVGGLWFRQLTGYGFAESKFVASVDGEDIELNWIEGIKAIVDDFPLS